MARTTLPVRNGTLPVRDGYSRHTVSSTLFYLFAARHWVEMVSLAGVDSKPPREFMLSGRVPEGWKSVGGSARVPAHGGFDILRNGIKDVCVPSPSVSSAKGMNFLEREFLGSFTIQTFKLGIQLAKLDQVQFEGAQLKEGDGAKSIFYGQIKMSVFGKILQRVQAYQTLYNPGNIDRVFIDIGAGLGQAVIAAAAFGGYSRVVGIEILPRLHKKSLEYLAGMRNIQFKHDSKIDLLCGDAFKKPFSAEWLKKDAGQPASQIVAYVNNASSTCMFQVAQHAALHMNLGDVVVSTYMPLPSQCFTIVDLQTKDPNNTWGDANVYIQIKSKNLEEEGLSRKEDIVREGAKQCESIGNDISLVGAEKVLSFLQTYYDLEHSESGKVVHILDAGCGIGAMAHWIETLSSSFIVVGVDLCSHNIIFAKSNFDNCDYYCMDLAELSSEFGQNEDAFDVIICNHVFEHLDGVAEMEAILLQMQFILRGRSGRLYLSLGLGLAAVEKEDSRALDRNSMAACLNVNSIRGMLSKSNFALESYDASEDGKTRSIVARRLAS